jgi:two-component system sensor histidine kinase DctS
MRPGLLAADGPEAPSFVRSSRWRRLWPWALLVGLLGVAQSLLLVFTLRYEHAQAQERVDFAAATAAADVRQLLARDLQSLQALLWNDPPLAQWRVDAGDLMRQRRELLRVEWRGPDHAIAALAESPYRAPLFVQLPRQDLRADSDIACAAASRLSVPTWSRSYFVPQPGGLGIEVMDVCLPILQQGQMRGHLAATVALSSVLNEAIGASIARGHELSFVEGDGTRLVRAGLPRGSGTYVAERLVDLPGATLALRLDSAATAPRLIPNLATALVLGLSLALAAVVGLLVRDVRRRADAEWQLGQELALRRAMENSLITGLRARDLRGRISYVNPAFCAMVGFPAEQLIGKATPPYWPPDRIEEYAGRSARRLAGDLMPSREGYETVFTRANGESLPVMVYEAPLIDAAGHHTGWMSAVLDLSEQRRIEEQSRQQQERLQATARLASVGELASLLSHELNQPLAAIASYATGSLNLMGADGQPPDAATFAMIQDATQRIATQAERAGRVIKSVHDFVRRREQHRERMPCDLLLKAVLPLVRLQARKSATQIELDLAEPAPSIVGDPTMLEQVLLNLTRNAIQSMDAVPYQQRVLTLRTRSDGAWVRLEVADRGSGIAPDVAQQLFKPFFTTKAEGMGLGLSLCRTVVEQHGGTLGFETGADGVGTVFVVSLPAAQDDAVLPEPQASVA